MLYLLMERYDNGHMFEQHYNKTTLIGVFESKELAEKEMKKLMQCTKEFIHADGSYVYDIRNHAFYYSTESYTYDIKEVELNKRIK